MKKIKVCFVIMFILMPAFAKAQFERGRFLIGGAGSLSYNNFVTGPGVPENVLLYKMDVRAGIFFRRGLAAGVLFDAERFHNVRNEDTRIEGHQILAGPFMRFYFRNQLFLAGDIAFGNGTDHISSVGLNQSIENKNYLFYGSFGLGYAILVGNNVAFEPQIDIDSSMIYNENSSDHVRRVRVRLSIGITVFLN